MSSYSGGADLDLDEEVGVVGQRLLGCQVAEIGQRFVGGGSEWLGLSVEAVFGEDDGRVELGCQVPDHTLQQVFSQLSYKTYRVEGEIDEVSLVSRVEEDGPAFLIVALVDEVPHLVGCAVPVGEVVDLRVEEVRPPGECLVDPVVVDHRAVSTVPHHSH